MSPDIISRLNPFILWAFGISGWLFFFGLFLFYRGLRAFPKSRLVADTPETSIRSIAMGRVRVHGKALGTGEFPSPVSHKTCFFYKVRIERWDPNGEKWRDYRTDADGVKFYLMDMTGKVLVDAHGADYDLLQTARVEVGVVRILGVMVFMGLTSSDPQIELRSYITSVTHRKLSTFEERRFNPQRPGLDAEHEKSRQAAQEMFKHPVGSAEFLDHALAAQGPKLPDHLTALGPQTDPHKEEARLALIEAYKHPYHSPEFKENMKRAIAARGGLAASLQGSESPFTGFPPARGLFRLTESCILPEHWYDVTGACTENPNPQDEHDRNLIRKGKNEPTFLISYRAAQEVERHLSRRAAAQIYGGAGLSLASLASILYWLSVI